MQRARLDPNGRILLPAAIRRHLGLHAGDEVLVHVEKDGRVAIMTPEHAWARAQALFDSVAPNASVVEELLAERRADATREARGGSGEGLVGR